MITILLDSSSNSLTVGIAENDKVIDSVSYDCWQTQSERMIPELEKLMENHGYKKEDISDVILSNGPGSYTGVRIAVTVAKVIATVLPVKVYPVSSLRILKCENKPSICLLNARSDRSYFGVYEGEKIIEEDKILENDEVKEYIAKHPEYIVCGDVKYLGLVGYNADMCKEMVSLKKVLEASENPLGIKPAYMKD